MKQRVPQIEFIGPAAIHDIACWLCESGASAVYDMHPNWVFRPCWSCQERLGLAKKKPWWKFW